MNKTKKQLFSTILTLSCTALAIGAATFSFAWHTNQKDIITSESSFFAALNQSVSIQNNSFKVFGFDILQGKATKTEGTKPDLSLQGYDRFVTDRNIYTSKYVRFTLDYPNGYIANQKLLIVFKCSGSFFIDNTSYVNNNMSNVISFKVFENVDQIVEDEENTASFYNECASVFSLLENQYTFIDKTDGSSSYTKGATISCTIDMPTLQTVNEHSSDMFMELSYDKDLIDYFVENTNMITSSDILEETSINFIPDIQIMSLSLV